MKHCPICNKDLSIDNFGIVRARKDGRNLYCKTCIRTKVAQGRADLRLRGIKRKRDVKATPKEQVITAIQNGFQTREAITSATRLPMDLSLEVIAKLWDAGELRIERVNEEPRFVLKEVA
jgi:hypothetical protein